MQRISPNYIFFSITTTKFKREKFLKRQQCQEATDEPPLTEVSLSPPPDLPQKIVKQHSYPILSSIQTSSTSKPKDEQSLDTSVAMPPRQPSLDPLCGLESLPLLYSSSGPRLTPPNLLRPALPIVRIIPDTEAEFQEPAGSQNSSMSFASQHYQTNTASIFESQYQDKKQAQVMSRLDLGSPQSPVNRYHSPEPGFSRQNISQHRGVYDQGRLETAPKHLGQFGHCPKVSLDFIYFK